MVGQCEGGESRATAESVSLDALNLHTRIKVVVGDTACGSDRDSNHVRLLNAP